METESNVLEKEGCAVCNARSGGVQQVACLRFKHLTDGISLLLYNI